MHTIVHILDHSELRKRIDYEMALYGPNCDLNHLDVSLVREMSSLFAHSNFNGDISKWDVGCVEIMDSMFENSTFRGDLSNWDVAEVNTFVRMFKDSAFNGDISKWQLKRADTMLEMFKGSKFQGDLSHWDMSKIKETRRMFHNAAFAGDMSEVALRNYSTYAKMFDQNFKGTLPFVGKLEDRFQSYGDMLGGAATLKKYLKAVPFNTVHADVLLGSKTKPGWIKEKDYFWVKEQQKVADNLGVVSSAMRRLLVQNFHLRHERAFELPDFGDLSI
jgi:hypothetical protein